MLLNVYLIQVQKSICVMYEDNHNCLYHQRKDTVVLLNVYLVLVHDENGQSPLFAASMFGSCDVVKCLLSSGADVNLCERNGRSPYIYI